MLLDRQIDCTSNLLKFKENLISWVGTVAVIDSVDAFLDLELTAQTGDWVLAVESYAIFFLDL